MSSPFKTIRIALALTIGATKKFAVYNALLSRILRSHTDKYKNKMYLSIEMENLYAANVSIASNRIGDSLTSFFMVTFANPRLVGDEFLFDNAVNLLNEIIYAHTAFDEKIFEEERKLLREYQLNLANDKKTFSNIKFNSCIFRPFGQASYEETLDILTTLKRDELFYYYKKLLLEGKKTAIINGPYTNLEYEKFNQVFKSDMLEKINPLKKLEDGFEFKIEEYDISNKQSFVYIGFHLPQKNLGEDATAVILNMIVGGCFESRLFQTIREEMALCYDVSSVYFNMYSIMEISVGVDTLNTDLATDRILEVMSEIKDNGITKEELEMIKRLAITNLYMRYSNQFTYLMNDFYKIILGADSTLKKKINEINDVTVEKVNDFAKRMKPLIVHKYRGVSNV